MIKMRRAQLGFGDGLIQAEIADLREDWMVHADQVLEDEQLVATVYEALGKRHPNSRSRGRQGTPADVVLRLLVLKHVRNWSYEVLEREVRANLVYRDFTRVGGAKMRGAGAVIRTMKKITKIARRGRRQAARPQPQREAAHAGRGPLGQSQGCQTRLHPQPLDQERRAQTRAEEALVPKRSEMAHRVRGTHQRRKAPARSRPLPLQRR